MTDPYERQADGAHGEWAEQERIAELRDELLKHVAELPEPTLGLKGGVNRQAVLDLIERRVR